MNSAQPDSHKLSAATLMLAVALVALTLVPRLAGLGREGLWYDELQSVTFAYLPVRQLLATVQVFDPHPPLYYLQLHYWLAVSQADAWVRLNSVLWSAATVFSIWWIARRLFRADVALLAALIFAVMPFAIFYAQEARMYAMLMCLAVWSFYFNHQLVEGDPASGVRQALLWAAFVLIALAFLYSHGASFLLLIASAVYGGLALLNRRLPRERTALWGSAQVVVCVAYLPWLIRAQELSVGHTLRPDLDDVARTLRFMWLGFGTSVPPWISYVVLGMALLVVVRCLVRDPISPNLALAYLVVPALFTLIVSYLWRPIWLYRTLAFAVPFWALALALCLRPAAPPAPDASGQASLLRWRALSVAALLVLALAWFSQYATFSHPEHFEAATRFVKERAGEGDIILILNQRVGWGWNWYYLGPGSVQPLAPDTVWRAQRGQTVISAPAIESASRPAQPYWLVYRPGDPLPPFADVEPSVTEDFGSLRVQRVTLPE